MPKLSLFAQIHAGFTEKLFCATYKTPFLVVYKGEIPAGEQKSDRGFETTAVALGRVLQGLRDQDPEVYGLAEARQIGMTTVGRAPNNDIVLASDTISKFHAYFKKTATDEYAVADAGSRNGTRVNGIQIHRHSPQILKGGELIEFARTFRAAYHTPESLFRLIALRDRLGSAAR